MTNGRNANHALVIHIRAGAPGESATMDTLLASMPCRVITWTDVYTGLAKLGQLARDPAQSENVRTVIVEVDSLAASEMPFFTFAARLVPHVPILVYGAHADAARVGEARNLGAAGWADKDTVAGLFESAGSSCDTTDAPDVVPDSTAEPARSPLDRRIDPFPSTPITPARSEAPPLAEVTPRAEALPQHVPPTVEPQPDPPSDVDAKDDKDIDADRNVPPARVPWLRYEDVPTRRGPTRVKPSAPEPEKPIERAEPTDAQKDSDDDSGPLLTDEELQALIGDDISAVTPREPSKRPPSGRSDQGGDA